MTNPPRYFADPPTRGAAEPEPDPPAQADDLLSEMLRSVRLSGERIAAYGPLHDTAVNFTGTGALHLIDDGEPNLSIGGSAQLERLNRGDVILVPRGDPHRLTANSEPARWLCGTFTIGDPSGSHLLATLPPAIVLRGTTGPALEGLDVARRMLVIEMESPSQGSAVMVARILDLIFIQILRAWAAGPEVAPNWLAGALDPSIGLALSAIHRDPGEHWTVEKLAGLCSLSRSAFAQRFVARVGSSPAAYLLRVRLDAATDLLTNTPLPVTQIAAKVGYLSEAAFSRAFRQQYGIPPARWRRCRQSETDPDS